MRGRTAASAAIAACTLVACGGGGGEGKRSDDEQQIQAALKTVLTTSGDPSVCSRLMTQRLREQVTFARGAAARAECRQDAHGEPDAKSLSVRAIRVSGPRATADVVPKGGHEFPFTSVRVGLRKGDGHWRLDRLKTAALDRPAFFRESRRVLTRAPNALPSGVADCALREIKLQEDEEIVPPLLKGDLRPLLVPAMVCLLRREAVRQGVPAPVTTCVLRRISRELTTGVLGRRIAQHGANLERAFRSRLGLKVKRAVVACTRSGGASGAV